MNQNAEIVRQLLALLTNTTTTTTDAGSRYVVVRGSASGVHAGYLVSQEGQTVRLTQSRRLWRWQVPVGAPSFLSGVAMHGIDHEGSHVGTLVDITLTDACEIIDASSVARSTIETAPEVERSRA